MSLSFIPIDYTAHRALIENFDCGDERYNDFLRSQSEEWAMQQEGLTYILVEDTEDETASAPSFIYAYATLSAGGLLRNNSPGTEYKSFLEIRLFAVHRSFRGNCDDHGVLYSYIFFRELMIKIWEISQNVLSFKGIFLASNDAGYKLYTDFGFEAFDDCILPTDESLLDIAGCKLLMIDNDDRLINKLFLD